MQLSNDREREMFIEAFWKARDTDPSTPENEVKIEHERRIRFANDNFGRGRDAGGWRSDQGRIYIMLGEPKQIEKYENLSNVYPMIVWFYSGLTVAQPAQLLQHRLLQAERRRRLHPLLAHEGRAAEAHAVLQRRHEQLHRRLPAARGDRAPDRPGLADPDPERVHHGLDALDLLRHPGQPEDPPVRLRRGPQRLRRQAAPLQGRHRGRIHGQLPRQRRPRPGHARRVRAGLRPLSRRAEPAQPGAGREPLPDDVRGQRHRLRRRRPDGLPVRPEDPGRAPGRSVRQDQGPPGLVPGRLPPDRGRLQVQPALEEHGLQGVHLHRGHAEHPAGPGPDPEPAGPGQPDRPQPGLRRPDQAVHLRGDPVRPLAAERFRRAGHAGPLLRDRRDHRRAEDRGSVLITLTRNDQVVASATKSLEGVSEPFRIAEEFPLAAFPPDYYLANVSVLDAAKTVVLSAKTDFYISLSPALSRAWILYAPLPGAGDPAYSHILGLQHFQAGDLAKARPLLEAAYRRSPGSVPFALDFCRLLFASKDYDGVRAVATPFYENKNFEFAQYLGESSQALGRYAEAIVYYKDYLTSFGTNLNVLNAIGDCYVKTGDLAGAQTAWKKSLDLNPAQDEIKKKLAELQERMKEKDKK
ncbi:MAG: GWxTD domain-containing protein [Candidatus Moduliflexus flocculans]|nr:GWxTD domain-containing protein [Candidatus Moduliflexus flocculans]